MDNDPSRKHSLWLCPSFPHFGRLQNIIERCALDYGTPIFSPHVTLLDGVYGTGLADTAAALAKASAPLQITLLDAAAGTSYFQCVYLIAHKGSN
ncbi:MAG: hypothetical protein AABY13_01345, partial [Nanoarchaeota archaeon]